MLVRSIQSVFLATVVLALASCGGGSGDDSSAVVPTFDGTRPSIVDLYSQDQIDALEALGLNFNLGDDPPNIEGTFRVEEKVLQASSVPGDNLSTDFLESSLTFSNQDDFNQTLDFSELEGVGEASGVGSGSFISGSGQAFTVYFIVDSTIGDQTAETTVTVSGIMTANGIENLQQANFMLDNGGDTDTWIPNNTGRLFIDQDGFSERESAAAVAGKSRGENARSGFAR